MSYSAIDFSRLPPPDVVEMPDAEALVQSIKADVLARAPELAAVLALESEPVVKLIEVMAYRELLLRARVNDAARAVMLATARGADLEHLGALYGVARLLIDAGDPDAIPPRAPVHESDDALRARIQLAPEALTVAGSRGSYEFHARSASAEVADIAVDSPTPGNVRVTVLAREGSGAAGAALLNTVQAALSAEDVRPLCDTVAVQSAGIMNYQIKAELDIAPGPDAGVVLERAREAVSAYAAGIRRIGQPVTISGLHAALHREGVARVRLIQPAAEVDPGPLGAAFCTGIVVGVAP
ncbi:baseplate assembly protein [Paracoccus sp. (in: a-proteobacteria)]|uniref:baseplate assembly protein n=1 Tax=Paracoccus sp. TaxID=267 RepID=UPI002AFFDCE8|nr:baseplate J/gp47 family protein [Paracoccus sp. (in: a-proteobacteria)]